MAWCSTQAVSDVSPETPDTLQRRAKLRKAGELFMKLYQRQPERYYEHPDYALIKELYRLADSGTLALLGHQLRSDALRPPLDMWDHFSEEAVKEAVAHVIAKRSQILRQAGADSEAMIDGAPSGKLLLYYPHENLACGAARYSSNGFFDDNNVPAWDTWVQYENKTLVSWVPTILVSLVQEGIDANPEQCIEWAPRGVQLRT
jgi:hypothetical protein